MANSKTHHGKNIKRLREMLGVKQSTLAAELGSDWNQKKISLLEDKPEVDDALLERVAEILKVPSDLIEHFDEEAAIYNIQNNYEGSNPSAGNVSTTANTGEMDMSGWNINPVDKWIEAMEENKKLYERLLQSEKEKVALLQSVVQELKGIK